MQAGSAVGVVVLARLLAGGAWAYAGVGLVLLAAAPWLARRAANGARRSPWLMACACGATSPAALLVGAGALSCAVLYSSGRLSSEQAALALMLLVLLALTLALLARSRQLRAPYWRLVDWSLGRGLPYPPRSPDEAALRERYEHERRALQAGGKAAAQALKRVLGPRRINTRRAGSLEQEGE